MVIKLTFVGSNSSQRSLTGLSGPAPPLKVTFLNTTLPPSFSSRTSHFTIAGINSSAFRTLRRKPCHSCDAVRTGDEPLGFTGAV